MSGKAPTVITLIVFLNFLMTCTSMKTPGPNEPVETYPSTKIWAAKFQEVQLTTVDNRVSRGMILRLEGENLFLSPVPYWNVDPVEINIDEIRSIKLMKKGPNMAKGFTWGFSLGFIVIGGSALMFGDLKYDEDYEDALTYTAFGAGGAGLLGGVIGGLISLGKKSRYNFEKMSKKEKIDALREIIMR
jgi:hypothetical protein